MIPRFFFRIGAPQPHFACGRRGAPRIAPCSCRFCDAKQSAAGEAETERKGCAAASYGQQFGPITEAFPGPVDTRGALRARTRIPGC